MNRTFLPLATVLLTAALSPHVAQAQGIGYPPVRTHDDRFLRPAFRLTVQSLLASDSPWQLVERSRGAVPAFAAAVVQPGSPTDPFVDDPAAAVAASGGSELAGGDPFAADSAADEAASADPFAADATSGGGPFGPDPFAGDESADDPFAAQPDNGATGDDDAFLGEPSDDPFAF